MTNTPTPNTTVDHAVEPNQQVVLTRGTASGFEQAIAAIVGLCTAGPLGAIASWGTIRGLQGKWTPWVVLGIPAAPILIGVQMVAIATVMPTTETYTSPEPSAQSQVFKSM